MGLFKIITKPIGCLFSLIGFLVVLTVLMVVGFIWAVDELAPSMAETALTQATGFPTTVEDGSVSFKDQTITLTNIVIDNPQDFPERHFARIAEFTVGLDRENWNEQQMSLSEVTLIIDELTFVQGGMEVSNLETFIEAAEENWQMMLEQIYLQAAEKQQSVPERMVINQLALELRRVKLASVSGDETVFRNIDLNYAKSFENVQSIRPVIEAVAADMQKSGISEIARSLEESAQELDDQNTLQMLQETLQKKYQQGEVSP